MINTNNNNYENTLIEIKELLNKCQKDARNIYDITMHERCEAQVQELFQINKGFHQSMTELMDNNSLLQDKILQLENEIYLLYKKNNES